MGDAPCERAAGDIIAIEIGMVTSAEVERFADIQSDLLQHSSQSKCLDSFDIGEKDRMLWRPCLHIALAADALKLISP